MWACALTSALVAFALPTFTGPDELSWGYFGFGGCHGADLSGEIARIVHPLFYVPLLWAGMLPLLGLGLLVWIACARWRRPGLGRWTVRALMVSALLVSVYQPALFTFDLVLEPDCVHRWGGWQIVWWTVGQNVLQSVGPVFALLAVQKRAPGLPRALVWAALVVVLALTPAADATRGGKVTVPDWEECHGAARPGYSGEDHVVAEIGYQRPTGVLEISDGSRALPDLAVGGPGHYRVRVHQRDLPVDYDREEPQASEEWLIMVYPGREKKPRTFVKGR
ncbi:hypothetical protein GCM10010404_36600 [Nonomuraea africana]